MNELFSKLRVSRSDSYLITLIVGALIFLFPHQISSIIFLIAGILLAVNGAVAVMNGLSANDHDGANTVFTGLARAALGLLLIFTRTWLLGTGIRLIGLFILVDGIVGIMNERNDKREKILHIVLAIVGFILLVNPFSIVHTTVRWFGIALMADGIIGLITGNNLIHR